MDNALGMKILNGIKHLQHIVFYFAFGESPLSFEEIVKGLNRWGDTLLAQS